MRNLSLLKCYLAGCMLLLATNAWAAEKALPSMEVRQFSNGVLYSLIIPHKSGFQVVPALSESLVTVEGFAKKNPNSVLVMNGGFFDPENGKTTSYLSFNGKVQADPKQNERLMENAKLKPYLEKIFNRSEFRVYQCAGQTRYDITLHQEPVPLGCAIRSSMGAGPQLLPSLSDQAEGFTDYDTRGKLTRDPIGVCHRNARSAVGLTASGDVIILMGAQLPERASSSGFTLPEMADFLKARGATKGLALDGGSSSSLVAENKAVYGKLDRHGQVVKRPVKSFLLVNPLP